MFPRLCAVDIPTSSLLVVTRVNGSPSGHHFSKHVNVKYSEIYGKGDSKKERLLVTVTNSLLSFHWDGSGRILLHLEHGIPANFF